MSNIIKKRLSDENIIAFYLYATLIIDLVRKVSSIFGTNINIPNFRNIIYILSLISVIIIIRRREKIIKSTLLLTIITILFFISYLINYEHFDLYKNSWLLFLFRLWPAYLIGRYNYDWGKVIDSTRRLIWLGFIYAIIMLTHPETAVLSYSTVASNLIYITLISSYSSIKNKKHLSLSLSLICWLPILIYGSRAMLFGFLLALIIFIIFSLHKISYIKKVLTIFTIFFLFATIIGFSESIINKLDSKFSESRTIKMVTSGKILDDANRFRYYNRIYESLSDDPFKIYGFLGDRIYHYSFSIDHSTKDKIESMYSHNVVLELCMNFGLIPGIIISLYFLYKIILCFKLLLKRKNNEKQVIFSIFTGVVFINMMVSVSYLNEYSIWLLFGIVFQETSLKYNNYINNSNLVNSLN